MKYGNHILIKPTMICMLSCDYCIVNKTLGKRPKFKEVSPKAWITLLSKRLPNVVTISGGEPMMYPGIEDIINYLTDRKVFVTISTNLLKLNLDINASKYLWLYATNHKTNNRLFEKNMYIYQIYGYNVSVSEFGDVAVIKGARLRKIKQKQTDKKIECYAPDLRKFNSWVEMEENGI